MRDEIMSYGGGVQSVAMCVLVKRGILPTPKFIVIADTGREATSTWDYLNNEIRPYMGEIEIHIAPHTLSKVDMFAHNGDVLLPMYVDGGGKLPTFCSSEWKRNVIQRWLRQNGVKTCFAWIGFSLDEKSRANRMVKSHKTKWYKPKFPLLELSLTRLGCEKLIKVSGLPLPPKSSCKMCPHRTDKEWLLLRDKYPTDFNEAIELEEDIRQWDSDLYLHSNRVPLSHVEFRDNNPKPPQQCGFGYCMV